ncbi:MAG: tetratricopeptide repeat protein [Muribaculaceae bacterium]|nr:tetratricopeptide repeat protein [Muribaculaceae bacterium]
MKKIYLFLFLFLALTVNAQSYYALVDSADSYIEKKEWAKAESSLLSALRLEPANYNNSLLLSNLATIQRMNGRYREAINNYSLALNITPNAVTLLNNRGSLYYEVDSTALAYKDFTKVMMLDAKDETSRYYSGLIALENRNIQESKALFDELLKINSKSIDAKDGLARWYQVSNNPTKASELYTELIKKEVSLDWLIHRAECYLEMKSLVLASADINDALKINPMNGYLYLLKARLNKMQFQNEEARKNIELAVKYGVKRNVAEMLIK